ncbi:thioredoxin-related protein [Algoriphagus sp. 4150]|uniref:thioredoxin family protein n=1 Tax=Algoriphagus sp. 4150 TaxID=2817756 RepID=UPI002866FEC8|nr:thioredoxin fold domain-containing protein [Algoriphagus sp. 4150]MDR7131245.1 thioredoxin-related protein [Algoriphagus sp. 4150]
MKAIILPFFFICVLLSTPVDKTYAQSSGIEWLSFEELDAKIDQEPKKVLIYFYTDWCTYCRKMEKEVFTNTKLIDLINQEYFAVKFDAESQEEVTFDGIIFRNPDQKKTGKKGIHELTKLLASRQGQFIPPTFLVLDKDFTVTSRHFEYLHSEALLNILAK